MITLINVLFGIDVPFGWRGRMCASADFVKQHHAAIDSIDPKTDFCRHKMTDYVRQGAFGVIQSQS
jgi:hypothetical protein